MVYETTGTPTSDCIVERYTVGSTSACRTILRSSRLVVFLVAPDPVRRTWESSRVHCSQHVLTAHSERSTWRATRRVDQPAVSMSMIRPLSDSLNCEKRLLTRLPGILRLLKSSSRGNVIDRFMNLPLCDDLYRAHFLTSAPLQGVWSCTLAPNLDHLHIGSHCAFFQSFTIVPFFLLGALFSTYLCVSWHRCLGGRDDWNLHSKSVFPVIFLSLSINRNKSKGHANQLSCYCSGFESKDSDFDSDHHAADVRRVYLVIIVNQLVAT
ncbi:hypothetical protein AVEN_26558-1 [Araneus ventricosus]|uniref:Uncharacterized protein n=1 Tax=Araneus ventricosus TaxID=182803 RepID=A0A4Y2FRC0_ARAVE|nr:hypothetical protein AVEN_26558-1 [Araneus ventricosus]